MTRAPRKEPVEQPSLFADPDGLRPDVQPLDDPEAERLAQAVPDWIHLGPSTWTFPGWAGLVYAGRPSQSALVRSGLFACSRYPLFRTVGIDRSFYSPLTPEELSEYSKQLPPGFPCIAKMWDEVTTCVFPRHPRQGARAGLKNPRFLDGATAAEVIAPYLTHFADHLGAILFELSPSLPEDLPSPIEFARRLDVLLSMLPIGPRYAFELRNRDLLTPRYLDTLRAHGAAHVLSEWTAMPPLGEQLAIPNLITAPFAICRLSLPPGARYEERSAQMAPFDQLKDPRPPLRADLISLFRQCAKRQPEPTRPVFVLFNNNVEGCSPLSVKALAREIARVRKRPV